MRSSAIPPDHTVADGYGRSISLILAVLVIGLFQPLPSKLVILIGDSTFYLLVLTSFWILSIVLLASHSMCYKKFWAAAIKVAWVWIAVDGVVLVRGPLYFLGGTGARRMGMAYLGLCECD